MSSRPKTPEQREKERAYKRRLYATRTPKQIQKDKERRQRWRSNPESQTKTKNQRIAYRERHLNLERIRSAKIKSDPVAREARRQKQKRRRTEYRQKALPINRKTLRSDGIGRMYFIQTASGPIKIGFTTKFVRLRMGELQVGNHEILTLLAAIPSKRDEEHKTHLRFEHLLIRGEWFRPEQELLQFILLLKTVREEAVKTV